jgi:hypothetical protein
MSGVFMDGGSSVFMDGGSQVFMDGGQDGGHHGHFQHGDGGGDGGVFVDAPQQHGGHAVQVGHGGDGFLSNILGLDSTHHHHGFLAHLLGLDHDGGGHHGHSSATHATAGHATSQGAIWSSALQGMKLSHFVQGINFSANFGLLMMFVGFTLWLFVIYAIRHNEPFANQVLGTVPMSESVAADRRLVNRLNNAMPVKISHGDVYEPLPAEQAAEQQIEQPVPQPQIVSPNTVPVATNPNQPFGLPVGAAPQQAELSGLPSGNAAATQSYSFTPSAQAQDVVAPAVPAQDLSAPMPAMTAQSATTSPQAGSTPPTGSGQSAYTVSSVPTRFGPKVKVIVNN